MNTQFIEFLAKNNAIRFGEFILKSGRTSPYFIDLGVLTNGSAITELGKHYANKINEVYKGDFDVVFGPAYKAIPLAISSAMALNYMGLDKKWLFDRKEVKLHGADANSLFVGSQNLDIGQKVVIVDDVMTTGGTKVEAITRLEKSLKAEVMGIVVAVDRMEINRRRSAIDEFVEETGVEVHAITDIKSVFQHLHNRDVDGKVYVDDKIYKAYEDYMKKYGAVSTIS